MGTKNISIEISLGKYPQMFVRQIKYPVITPNVQKTSKKMFEKINRKNGEKSFYKKS